ncbi:P1 family peptidase [Glutamicibacter sp.]|uniref:P1 family peptidase n=1 Tax=Glutamicibacter sp. TaxID=1931995 RepID=UPI0028BEAAB9|nr:P1 family peptidase [Glutamicibacter sp.]
MAQPREARLGIDGVQVGQADLLGSGCTVVLLPEGTIASAEVRGGAPASRELDVLNPLMSVQQIDAAVLTGGSAFGLACADGVMQFLEELGRGVPTPSGRVPIVPTLSLFDLAEGAARPTAADGYWAAKAAWEYEDSAQRVLTGTVGAGSGAKAGRWRGPGAYPGGLVYAERSLGELVVGALCAVNAFGDVLAVGATPSIEPAGVFAALDAASRDAGNEPPRTHTTIGVLITNAKLDKVGCHILAQGGHDGLARAVHPPHTRLDGDAFIAAATGQVAADVDTVRMLGMLAVSEAIVSAAPAQ